MFAISSRWIAAGIALDAMALAPFWAAVIATGGAPNLGSSWAPATVFTTIPWAVHVVLLPAALGLPRVGVSRGVATTATYLALAALLIPAVGALAFWGGMATGGYGVPFLSQIANEIRRQTPGSPLWFAEAPVQFATIVCVCGPVGAALGLMGNQLRRALGPAARPSWRADAAGGVAAAVLAACLLGLAQAAGMFAPQAFAAPVFLPLAVLGGALAFLPHLILTRPHFNPPRATSISGAEPSAPS